MSTESARSVLTDQQLTLLGTSREAADRAAAAVAEFPPLTPEQRDQLAVLLSTEPPPLARGA